jgi:hypothetical protein
MKILNYNYGSSKNGLYCDLDKEGQCYNVRRFLEEESQNKTGILQISFTKKDNWYKLKKQSNNGFNTHYHFVNHPTLIHFSLDSWISKAKNIWIKIIPTKRTKK